MKIYIAEGKGGYFVFKRKDIKKKFGTMEDNDAEIGMK